MLSFSNLFLLTTIIVVINFQLFDSGWAFKDGMVMYGNLAKGICAQRHNFMRTRSIQKSLKNADNVMNDNPLLCLDYENGEFFARLCSKTMPLPRGTDLAKLSRINGGFNAILGQFPWMVSIQQPYYDGTLWKLYHCGGGTLIGNKWVLTAAHVIVPCNGVPFKNAKILMGTVTLGREPTTNNARQLFTIRNSYKHPQHNIPPGTEINDIGLIELDRFYRESRNCKKVTVHPDNFNQNNGETILMVGFGSLIPNGPSSKTLKYISGTTISNTRCQQYIDAIPYGWTVRFNQICVRPGVNFCSGDSGGGGYYEDDPNEWYSVGVICCRLLDCDKPNGINVFSDATSQHAFINEIIDTRTREDAQEEAARRAKGPMYFQNETEFLD